jgi:hypothetical protein
VEALLEWVNKLLWNLVDLPMEEKARHELESLLISQPRKDKALGRWLNRFNRFLY